MSDKVTMTDRGIMLAQVLLWLCFVGCLFKVAWLLWTG